MLKKIIIISLFSTILLARPNSGFIELDLLYLQTKDNFYTGNSVFGYQNEKIITLGKPKNSINKVLALPRFELINNNFYLNNKEFKTINFGYKSDISKDLILDLSFSPNFSNEYKNPYITNKNREISNTTSLSLNTKVSYKNFIDFIYTHTDLDIKADESNEIDPSLLRSGSVDSFGVVLNAPLKSIGFNYEIGKKDGISESYEAYKMGVKSIKPRGKILFINSANYETKYFEAKNPVFDKKRDEIKYTLSSIVLFSHITSKKDYTTFGILISKTDSQIPFFNNQNIIFFSGYGYKF